MIVPLGGKVVCDSNKSIQKLLGNYSINTGYDSNYSNQVTRHPFPGEEDFKLENWEKVDAAFVYIGCGWNLQKGFNFDLNASIITFNVKNNLLEIMYHKNLQNKNVSMIYKEDNKIGEGKVMMITNFGSNCFFY